jgi:hypothetical protein
MLLILCYYFLTFYRYIFLNDLLNSFLYEDLEIVFVNEINNKEIDTEFLSIKNQINQLT